MSKENPNKLHWHGDLLPVAPGCSRCPDVGLCGGLRVASKVESCLSYCECGPSGNDNRGTVCKCNPTLFVQRKREVGGWGLDVPHATVTPFPALPPYLPMVYDRSNRSCKFSPAAVAISLAEIINARTGNLAVRTQRDLHDRFLIDDVPVLISAVHHDPKLEIYWSKGRCQDIAGKLAELNISAMTTPNFSLFADVPRWDNLHSMKRIAICWYELATAGIPTALHVNARTSTDYQRWASFLVDHSEIEAIAFEFQTGPASPARGAWHAECLQRLVEKTGRAITLLTFGGIRYLPVLMRAFDSVVLISSEPHMKAKHRRKLVLTHTGNRVRGALSADTPVDELLRINSQVYEQCIASVSRDVA